LTKGEMLKFIGVVMLSTRFKFRERASLWSTTASGKYQPAACFGKSGMVRKRFDEIWGNLTFSHQPEQRPNNVCSETYWWQCAKGFVDRLTKHRAQQIIPLDILCVDKSTARWYGRVVIGSITDCLSMLRLIGNQNQRLAARSRIQHVGAPVGLYYG
jgi:hypothetical protein